MTKPEAPMTAGTALVISILRAMNAGGAWIPLPDVEENDPGYREFICGEQGVIRKWLRLGASGWRLDVADELPDSFIAAVRSACKAEKADALLMGEVWEDASHKISYDHLREYLLGRELNCTMHYPFRDGAVAFILGRRSAEDFAEDMESIRENYPPEALAGAMNLIGTHRHPQNPHGAWRSTGGTQ